MTKSRSCVQRAHAHTLMKEKKIERTFTQIGLHSPFSIPLNNKLLSMFDKGKRTTLWHNRAYLHAHFLWHIRITIVDFISFLFRYYYCCFCCCHCISVNVTVLPSIHAIGMCLTNYCISYSTFFSLSLCRNVVRVRRINIQWEMCVQRRLPSSEYCLCVLKIVAMDVDANETRSIWQILLQMLVATK